MHAEKKHKVFDQEYHSTRSMFTYNGLFSVRADNAWVFLDQVRLRQKHHAPQVRPDEGSNS